MHFGEGLMSALLGVMCDRAIELQVSSLKLDKFHKNGGIAAPSMK